LIYSEETELTVLGSIIKQPWLMEESTLRPEQFGNEALGYIYQKMINVKEKDKDLNLYALSEELGPEFLKSIGGMQYFIDLQGYGVNAAAYGSYEKLVKDGHIHRMTEQELQKLGQMTSIHDIAAAARKIAENIEETTVTTANEYYVPDLMEDYDERIEQRMKEQGRRTISTLSKNLDNMTGGYRNKDLIIVGAPPSVGKTAFAVRSAVKAAINDPELTIYIFSIEMSYEDMIDRMISGHMRIDGMRIQSGRLTDEDWNKYTHGLERFKNAKIILDDSPSMTIEEISAKVRKVKKKHGKVMVVDDYLQRVSTVQNFGTTREKVTHIVREMKKIAKENDLPFVCISSLARPSDRTGKTRPTMSMLRESGDIEFEADVIMLLYREDYFNKTEETNSDVGEIEIIVDKNRKGKTGVVKMIYERNFSNFMDLEGRYGA